MIRFRGVLIDSGLHRFEHVDRGVVAVGSQMEFRAFGATLHPPESVEHPSGTDLLGDGVAGRLEVVVAERDALLEDRELDRRRVDHDADRQIDGIVSSVGDLAFDEVDRGDQGIEEGVVTGAVDVREGDRPGREFPQHRFHLGEAGDLESEVEGGAGIGHETTSMAASIAWSRRRTAEKPTD